MNKPVLVPKVKSRKNFGRLKIETTLYVQDCPLVITDYSSFVPSKVTILSYPEAKKARVHLTGETNHGLRTASYNLLGYNSLKPAPKWLTELLLEVRACEGIFEL